MALREVLALMANPVKVMICIPTEGHTPAGALDTLMMMQFHNGKLEGQNPGKYEFYQAAVGRVLTPLARERLTEWAQLQGCDLMLMCDDDMLVPYDLFERLHETMVKHQADVVAALAFTRVAPHFPVIYRVNEGYDAVAHKPFYEREIVKNYPKDTVVECDAVGFGSVLINLHMVKKMKKPYFMSTTGAGEDIWFCYSAKKEANAKIVMDTRVKLGHIGNPPVIWEADYERINNVVETRRVMGDAPKELVNVGL